MARVGVDYREATRALAADVVASTGRPVLDAFSSPRPRLHLAAAPAADLAAGISPAPRADRPANRVNLPPEVSAYLTRYGLSFHVRDDGMLKLATRWDLGVWWGRVDAYVSGGQVRDDGRVALSVRTYDGTYAEEIVLDVLFLSSDRRMTAYGETTTLRGGMSFATVASDLARAIRARDPLGLRHGTAVPIGEAQLEHGRVIFGELAAPHLAGLDYIQLHEQFDRRSIGSVFGVDAMVGPHDETHPYALRVRTTVAHELGHLLMALQRQAYLRARLGAEADDPSAHNRLTGIHMMENWYRDFDWEGLSVRTNLQADELVAVAMGMRDDTRRALRQMLRLTRDAERDPYYLYGAGNALAMQLVRQVNARRRPARQFSENALRLMFTTGIGFERFGFTRTELQEIRDGFTRMAQRVVIHYAAHLRGPMQ